MKTSLSLRFKTAKIVIAIAAMAPFAGFAASAHAAPVAEAATQVSTFCAKVDASTSTLETLISEKEASYENGRAANAKALAASRKASDKALYDARVAANGEYAAQFKDLLAEADTAEEKAAVAAFKKTVMQAVATRRANVDVAVSRYREGVDAILSARSSSYKDALKALRASVDQSLTRESCAGVQTAFETKLADIGDSADALAALSAVRDEKVTAADAKFNAILSTATAALKTALGQ